jgi:hypothetical protein
MLIEALFTVARIWNQLSDESLPGYSPESQGISCPLQAAYPHLGLFSRIEDPGADIH